MPTIKITDATGETREVAAQTGLSLMEVAVDNNIAGMVAECGGACACATCHIYVPAEWQGKTGDKTDMEETMLDFAEGVEEGSRLACQIKVSDEIDGITVKLPTAQF